MTTPRHQTILTVGNRTLLLTTIIGISLLLLNPLPIHAASSSASATRSRRSSLPLNNHRQLSRRRFDKPFLIHSSGDTDAPLLQSSNDKLLERLRGGALLGGNKQASSDDHNKSLSRTSSQEVSANNSKNRAVKIGATAVTIFAIILSILHWDTLKSFFDKDKFRKAIIQRLNDIASKGNKGLLMYTFGFIFWEVCGLPTMVVETAAGMAFGFRHGLLGSFVGKTCGSMLAFTLGRTLLSNIVGKKMKESSSFGLIERGVAKNPMLSALVIRYSPFPELIKNYGLSVTKPVTYLMFLVAIIIHGFPFSILWAALGNDSSLRLRASEVGETMAANVILNGLVVFVTIFGFVVSPAVTGWWIADLNREKVD